MRAFVVRPFGKREGIDFDAVGAALIAPALSGSEFSGNTTEAITESGSIHEDMFLELLGAQLVVADISIHNANVFYELGIRHALRPRATILLRATLRPSTSAPRADIPFDIHGLRYCNYDPDDPGAAVDALKKSIRDTAAAYRVDSPIYRLLPDLSVDAEKLRVLPLELAEQIEQARQSRRAADLRLLAEDVTGMRFEEPALRLIAKALNDIGDSVGAIDAWVRLRITRPNDYDANHELATLYARRGDLTGSDQTIARALSNASLTASQHSELSALRGSNLKRRWQGSWRAVDGLAERQRWALRSPLLDQAIAQYTHGFHHDLNKYWAGLNALALAHLQLRLAQAQPDTWQTNFATEAEAGARCVALQRHIAQLATSVDAVLTAKADDAQLNGQIDPWLLISLADARFLLIDEQERVAGGYQQAAAALEVSQLPAVTAQLKLFADLGVRTELAEAALTAVARPEPDSTARAGVEALVFIGHMIDRGDERRFPPEREDQVTEAIEARVLAARDSTARAGRELIGLAAASDGGDIIFHEVCARIGVATCVYLPVPDELFRSTSQFPPGWLGRYLDLVARRPVRTMNASPLVPSWLDLRPETSSWPRFNRWILHHAKVATDRVTVLALWDGRPSRGLGGVANMVDIAPRRGVAVDAIHIGDAGPPAPPDLSSAPVSGPESQPPPTPSASKPGD
jgi:hypothetical protein